MNRVEQVGPSVILPALAALGDDLLEVSKVRLVATLSAPFVAMVSYAFFSWNERWLLAVVSVMALSFVTYGSTSHDLVHRSLHLPRGINDFLLSMIELLSLRSGTAYRLSHIHHHQHLLDSEDIEGAASHGTLAAAVASGVTTQLRLWLWSWTHHPSMRRRLALEGLGVVVLMTGAMSTWNWNRAPAVYAWLVIAGSWLFPLITVYIPHNAQGDTPLSKTRLFRGLFYRYLAFDHLYHLEHHLYPAVPHHHWRTLGQRLDPYLAQAGIQPWSMTGSQTRG